MTQMSEGELEQYHLGVQAREIAEMSSRTKPFTNLLAGIGVEVHPRVYPGGIDSEITVLAMGDTAGKRVLDLCTGTGIVAVKAALAGADRVLAVDLNPDAVANAVANAEKYRLRHMEVREGSLFEPVGDEKFDVIAINPPYTGKMPKNKTEICFWDDENQTTISFFEQYKAHLLPSGRAYLAWANFSSIELIKQLAEENDVELKQVQSRSTPSGLATFLVYELVSK